MRIIIVFVLFIASTVTAPRAQAHNKVPIEEDKCVVRLGEMSVHFTAYQFGSGTEYCWDLPAAGKNILVFDFLVPKMRKLKTEVAVIESASGNPNDEQVIAHLEPQTYPSGTLSLEANLENGKSYYAKLTLADTKPLTFKAPLHIGPPKDERYMYLGGGLGLLLVLGGLAYFLRSRMSTR